MGNGATVQRKREVVIVQHMANVAAQMQAERDAAHEAWERQLAEHMQAERDAAHEAMAAQMQAERDAAHEARKRQLAEHMQAERDAAHEAMAALQAVQKAEEKAVQEISERHLAALRASTQERERTFKHLLFEDLESNEEQTQTAKRSGEQRSTSADGNSKVTKSAEERTTNSKLPTFHDFTLLWMKDFLNSFEWMLEQAKAQGIDVVGQIFKIANFAAAILDCHGGFLSIDDLDVHLCVPLGAIPEGQTQRVYIFVTGTSSVDKHSFSTPVVHCGPPDHVFNKDVVLTMPHCVKDATSCKFSLSKLSSGGSCEDLDVITVVDNNSIAFPVKHFCGYAATASRMDGTILEKYMVACAFIREHSDEVELRLQLVDNIQVNVHEVITKEREFGFHLADMESPLTVRKNDRAVVAKISNCTETWKISRWKSCKQKIRRGLLWRETVAPCAQAFPYVTFVVNRCSGSKKVSFRARMTVYQKGSESCDHRVTFFVDATKGRCLPLVPDRGTQMERTQEELSDQMHRKPEQPSCVRPKPCEESIFKKLYDLLDESNPLGHDWCRLLNLLFETDSGGCSVSIDGIREKAGRERRSPTEIVVELFFGRKSGETEEEKNERLKRALIDVGREDVKQFAHRFDSYRPG